MDARTVGGHDAEQPAAVLVAQFQVPDGEEILERLVRMRTRVPVTTRSGPAAVGTPRARPKGEAPMDTPHPKRDDARNLVSLTDDSLERARRAMLDEISETLKYATDQVDELRGRVWPPEVIVVDCRATLGTLRKELDAMDALGWPKMERE